MSFFNSIDTLPEDPILSLPAQFAADLRPNKIDLGIGVYRNAKGVQPVLSCVQKAEARLLERKLDKKYLPIEGYKPYIDATLKLIFGENFRQDRIFCAQSIGGTGALYLSSKFLRQHLGASIFVSEPCWPNHPLIFTRAELGLHYYPYFCSKTKNLNFDSMCKAIKAMAPGSIILLQASCHNPTGISPNPEQWKILSELVQKQEVFPLFDFAYQGLGDGLDEDAAAVRYFYEQGHEMMVAYSYSKNLGLYGERLGAFAIVSHTSKALFPIASQIKQLIRSVYSMPALQGARIAAEILTSPDLRTEWLEELSGMQERIMTMRMKLQKELRQNGQQDFSFIGQQRGLFSYLGLSAKQVALLQKEYALFMPTSGRINVAGLTDANVKYVGESILSVL